MRFRALTFDCYGTLIDWDTEIGFWLEGWAATKGVAADRDSLMEDFAEAQRAEQATPHVPVVPNGCRQGTGRVGCKQPA